MLQREEKLGGKKALSFLFWSGVQFVCELFSIPGRGLITASAVHWRPSVMSLPLGIQHTVTPPVSDPPPSLLFRISDAPQAAAAAQQHGCGVDRPRDGEQVVPGSIPSLLCAVKSSPREKVLLCHVFAGLLLIGIDSMGIHESIY